MSITRSRSSPVLAAADRRLVPEPSLPEKTVSLEPAEQLLALAADFTRFHDLHLRHAVNGNRPSSILTTQTAGAQALANSALDIVTALNKESMYHSPVIRAVYVRIRQLAHLATDAADHLIDADDILIHAQAGLPMKLGDGFLAIPSEQDARQEIGHRFTLVSELTALGAFHAVATAEQYGAERRRYGYLPEHRPPALSRTQHSTLHAIARGDVTISDGRPYHRREGARFSITTIRALENRGLITREDCHLWLVDERVHLSPAGRRDLAASFAHPQPPTLATTRPAAPRPAAPRPTASTTRAH
ncbi:MULTISPECIES: hypothetical protein [unclassified Streptomyces]|uniref:hypothetical protein n=1 Tax=unclassified Streptomyces TaxID=2593676 RepID=UPI00403CA7AA